jgi:hypothetical protein
VLKGIVDFLTLLIGAEGTRLLGNGDAFSLSVGGFNDCMMPVPIKKRREVAP